MKYSALGSLVFIGLLSFSSCREKAAEVMLQSPVKEEAQVEIPDYIIKNQVILSLTSNEDLKALELDFGKISLTWIESIAPSMRMHLFEFDETAIPHDQVLMRLKSHNLINEAEFNKKLSPRK